MHKRDKEALIGGGAALLLVVFAMYFSIFAMNDIRATNEENIYQRYQAELARYDSMVSEVRKYIGVLDYDKAFQALHHCKSNMITSVNKLKEWENLQDQLLVAVLDKANNLNALGKYDMASHYYELYLNEKKDSWLTRDLMVSIIECYDKAGNGAVAVQTLDSYVKSNPAAYDLLLYKARILRRASGYREAKEALDIAVKHIAKDYESRHGAAYAMMIDPKNYDWPSYHYDIFCERAEVCALLNNFKDAKTSYTWAQFIQPNHGHAYYAEALANKRAGNANQACKLWYKAKQLGWKVDSEGVGCL